MKKIIAAYLMILLCVVTALTGCAAPSEAEQAMEQVLSANNAAALLEQYDNITLSFDFPDGYKTFVFVDEETFLFTDESHSVTTLFTPQEQCEVEILDGTEYFHRYINPFNADLGAMRREGAFLIQATEREKVTSFTQDNGVLYIETRLAAEDLRQEEMEYMGILMEKGEYYACEYQVDAQTYRILRSDEYIIRADGSREDLGRITLQVNTDKPAYIAEVEAKGAAIDALPAEQVRIITCVIDPGLETERTIFKTVMKESYVLFPEDLQGYDIYMDPEGTQPLVNTPGQAADSSFTVYLIKNT